MPRLIYVTRPPVPVEALRLTEDIYALQLALQLLKTVDRYNVADDPDRDIVWMCIQKLKMCQRYAENKMRKEYLDPRRKKIQR